MWPIILCGTFSIAITSLGEERANLSAFRTFARFARVWFCLFPLPLGVWDWLRLVIVALPGLFILPFLWINPRLSSAAYTKIVKMPSSKLAKLLSSNLTYCTSFSIYYQGVQSMIASGRQNHQPWKHIVRSCSHWWWSQCQIAKASATFGRLSRSIWGRTWIGFATRLKVYRSVVLSALLYGMPKDWITSIQAVLLKF